MEQVLETSSIPVPRSRPPMDTAWEQLPPQQDKAGNIVEKTIKGAVTNSVGQFAENACDAVTAPGRMVDSILEQDGKGFLGATIDLGSAAASVAFPLSLARQAVGSGVAGALDANGVNIPSKVKPIVMGEKDCLKAHFAPQVQGNTSEPQENTAPEPQSPLPKVGMGMLY